MNLEDGRFLMDSSHYDTLFVSSSSTSKQQQQQGRTRIERVDPRFRVIALGVPVPQFPGNPIDPPLRSRFQARNVATPSAESLYSWLLSTDHYRDQSSSVLTSIVAIAKALQTTSFMNNTSESSLSMTPALKVRKTDYE